MLSTSFEISTHVLLKTIRANLINHYTLVCYYKGYNFAKSHTSARLFDKSMLLADLENNRLAFYYACGTLVSLYTCKTTICKEETRHTFYTFCIPVRAYIRFDILRNCE